MALSWSFVNTCRAAKNFSHLTSVLPAEVEQGDLWLLGTALVL